MRKQRIGHGAMVRSQSAAAGGQTRIIAAREGRRKRPETEDKCEDDGNAAPHLNPW